MPLFGSSGIRTLADRGLLDLALKVGLSLSKKYPSVVVGMDTRSSSESVKYALVSGLLAGGCCTCDAGIIPTPTLAFITRNFAAGVMITASHNPPEYNGIKLWNSDGSAFDEIQRECVENDINNDSLTAVAWEKMRQIEYYNQAIDSHMDRILEYCRISSDQKVVVDCNCGTASGITPRLLSKLGCDVIAINCYKSAFFPHPIEPTVDNLGVLSQIVQATHANLGIAHDGDADRMVAVDNKGRFISGDKLLNIFSKDIRPNKVVTTVDASMAIEELGYEIIRTKVGDAFVSEELKRGGQFGGEPSGSWIFPELSYCPDGILAAAQLVKICDGKDLADMIDALPTYPILRGSITIKNTLTQKQMEKLKELKPLSVNRTDGMKLIFEDGWLLVRPSGTEPKVRLTVETRSLSRTKMLYNAAVQVLTVNS